MKVERYTLNGKKVRWTRSKKKAVYTLKIDGVESSHRMFGQMVRHIEQKTGVNYPW